MITFPTSLYAGGGASGSCAPITNTTSTILNSGTGADESAVLSNYWIYSHSQAIYTAAELGSAKQITALEYYNDDNAAISWTYETVVIKIAHCTGTSFSAANFVGTFPDQEIVGVAGITDETEVFNGTLSLTNSLGWNSISLSTNFCYDGTSNVVISISKSTAGSGSCSSWAPGCGYTFDYARWRYTNDGSGSNTGVWFDDDNNIPTGISSTGSTTLGDINNFRAHLRLTH